MGAEYSDLFRIYRIIVLTVLRYFDDRELLLRGGNAMAQHIGLDQLRSYTPWVILDEIHKFPKWKQLVKGFYDKYQGQCHILITGSARMDVYKKGGDSLMGRYFN